MRKIKDLASQGDIRISDHGYDELAVGGLFVRDIVTFLPDAELLEDYPDFPKGPCVLVLQRDRNADAVHAVWGIPKGEASPAALITAYRLDDVREALRRRDVKRASRLARVFALTPVAV